MSLGRFCAWRLGRDRGIILLIINMQDKKTDKKLEKIETLLNMVATHSTIFIGNEKDYQDLKDEIKNSTINYLFIDKTEDNKNLLSEDVASIQDFIKTKTSSKRYVVSNRNIRNTTLQDRLLKILEEGGDNTFIIFVLDTADYLVPTVLSRVQLVHLENSKNINTVKIKTEKAKEKLIKNKNFNELEKILHLERAYNMGTITEKNFEDYISLI